MGRLFGTDGVRGLANAELTPALAVELASSAARILVGTRPAGSHGGQGRPVAVLGRDPRVSGEMLEAAVAAGLASAGVDVSLLGVLPTPAVAYLTGAMGADLGVVISASHNDMPDNGIKLFAAGGAKLDDVVEDAIEADMAARAAAPLLWQRPVGADIGRIRSAADAQLRYLEHLRRCAPHPLDGLRVVVDCANGAAATVAPQAYRQAGAQVLVIAGEPDGENINRGVGSTHLAGLQAAVRESGADLGIAHDGDADRCLAVDHRGAEVNGDAILAILAVSLQRRGALAGSAVVGTVMANLGFHRAMSGAGIRVETTAVGDRYVLEAMRRGGFSLGGEQSGHIILAEQATTGDGLLTALHLMGAVAAAGRTLAELAAVVTPFPQVLRNVRVLDKAAVAASAAVAAAVEAATDELGDAGRVLLRPSGTEPLVRVMVEAATAESATEVAERVAAVVALA